MMTQQQTFKTGEAPLIVIERCGGDLTIRAWDQPELEVNADDSDLSVTQNENEFRCKIYGNGSVQLPRRAQLQIQEAHGNANLLDVQGEISIESVSGDCRIHQAGPLSIENVAGNLFVQSVEGPLQAENVAGDLRVRQIAGDVNTINVAGDAVLTEVHGSMRLENAGGDVKLRQIEGQVHVGQAAGNASLKNVSGNIFTHAGGDLSLKGVTGNINAQASGDVSVWLSLHNPQHCHIRAEGDLTCRIPSSAGATVSLDSGGRTIVKYLDTEATSGEIPTAFVIGGGESKLNLSAGGDLTLIGNDHPGHESSVEFEFDFGHDFAEQIAAQVEVHMEQITQQLNEKLAHIGDSDEIAARVHDRVQHAMHKAEEKIARALQYAERRINAAERKAEKMHAGRRRAYRWSTAPQPPTPPQPPKPPRTPGPSATPATDEERMMILRMVEEGKISVEQAETLLSALDE